MSEATLFAEQAVSEARERPGAPGLSDAERAQCQTELAAAEARLAELHAAAATPAP